MADLTDGADRAQMLLVGAVVFALVLVTLAFVLNSTIYSGALAGQANEDVSSSGLQDAQQDIRSAAGTMLRNSQDDYAGRSGQSTAAQRRLNDHLQQLLAAEYQNRGAIITISSNDADFEDGVRITDDTDSDPGFTEVSDPVVSNRHVRNLTFFLNPTATVGSAHFTVEIQPDMGSTVTVEIYDDSGTGETVVDVDGAGECRVSGTSSRVSVDLSRAIVGDDHCNTLDRIDETTGPYTVSFSNPDTVTDDSSFSMVTDETTTGPSADTKSESIYALVFDVEYHDSTTDYDGTVRVAPGELGQ